MTKSNLSSVTILLPLAPPVPSLPPLTFYTQKMMVLQQFFSGSLGWLKCYIAPMPYKEHVKPPCGSLEVLYWFFSLVQFSWGKQVVRKSVGYSSFSPRNYVTNFNKNAIIIFIYKCYLCSQIIRLLVLMFLMFFVIETFFQ